MTKQKKCLYHIFYRSIWSIAIYDKRMAIRSPFVIYIYVYIYSIININIGGPNCHCFNLCFFAWDSPWFTSQSRHPRHRMGRLALTGALIGGVEAVEAMALLIFWKSWSLAGHGTTAISRNALLASSNSKWFDVIIYLSVCMYVCMYV